MKTHSKKRRWVVSDENGFAFLHTSNQLKIASLFFCFFFFWFVPEFTPEDYDKGLPNMGRLIFSQSGVPDTTSKQDGELMVCLQFIALTGSSNVLTCQLFDNSWTSKLYPFILMWIIRLEGNSIFPMAWRVHEINQRFFRFFQSQWR